MSPKIFPALLKRIEQSNPAEWLDVIIELEGGSGEVYDIAAAKQEFARVSAPVIERIEGMGGEVVNRAWINHTLRARLLAQDIPAVGQLGEVLALDVAQMIGQDAVHEPGDGLLADLCYMEPSVAASAASTVRNWRNMPREEFQEFARGL